MTARRFLTSVVCFLLALSFVPALQAQNNTATLTGVVTDTTGAAVPGVNVTLRNTATDTTYKTVTNDTGSYTFTEVKPGPGYDLVLEREGFEKEQIAGLYLNIAVIRTQNAQLKVGQAQETVTVSAASQTVSLDTTDATVGNNFQVSYLEDLPIANRSNPSALFTQQPGMALDGSATGARTDQDRVTLDGLDVNDLATGSFGTIVGNAPVDSVQEFRGEVAGALSTSGPGGGGQFDLVTKSGTNSFHGDAVEYYRDRSMEANTWFNNNATPQVTRPPLIRNQFGGALGGPILRNRAYFYFDYNGRRDTLSNTVNRTVPLDSYRNQTITYFNSTGNGSTSTMGATQAAQLDPLHQGFSSQLLNAFTSRYPHSNNLQVGDTLNTGGFEFNAPFPYTENDFVGRVDYTLNSNMKISGVGHWTRTNGTESAIQFPGDPETHPFLDQSYSWVVGHTWTISTNKINQFYGGTVTESYAFPNTYNPTGATQWQTFGGNGSGGAILDSPYGSAINAQGRTYPIPVIRDDFTWVRGGHSITFGGAFKWPDPLDFTILNYNTPTLGLGGHTSSLAVPNDGTPSLRPSNIGSSSNALSLYDQAYALALAPITANGATFYYNSSLSPIPQGTAQSHRYKYKELEGYVNDTWKATPNLTLTYGLQWQFFSVPYDANGIQSISEFADSTQKFDFTNYFGDRVSQSAQGVTGNLAIPLIQYVLGGKANHAPGYYQPQYNNFAPKLAFAWNPSFDRKGVWSGGAAIVYDQTVINAVQYQQSQYSYLFQASNTQPYGTTGNAYKSLQADARFGGFSAPPAAPPAPADSSPFLPYVTGTGSNAVPNGLQNGLAFNEIMDPQLKTPYSIQYNFGYQHQFPQGYLMRLTYVGRLGRRLLAQVDAEQLIDFPDKASGQLMSQAFANISVEQRNNQPITAQPWYEDILPAGIGQAYGFSSNSALVAGLIEPYVARGDFADTTQALSGILPPNVGMAAQFSENTFYTNQGFSDYNGLLATLHKNVGYGLQFDVNYTWSHSIDNVSVIANAPAIGGYGFICDELRPRECRGNSDFGIRNILTGNFLYTLPIGRGQMIGSSMPFWLNELAGGWEISGLPSWQTGLPFAAGSNAFVAGYANDAPAILTGQIADMKVHLNGGKGAPLFAFSNPTKAQSDYTGPIGFQIGSRNNLFGPHFFDMDLGAGKSFPIWEQVALKFRADAFNAFNHPNFNNPSVDITANPQLFGEIGSTQSNFGTSSGEGPRVLQGSLRLEF